ncbi:hypothetical protein ACFR9U_21030 [Halorientalis brevis]|uniref:Uncharacterized protein n=1 Tax=Halorientalis brevis TaxID=1126241 RepID=A0ABD6CGV5_9EURY|nr:hypothetical protein [Halorientalis brevis]
MAGNSNQQDGINRRRYLGLAAAVAVAGCSEAASSRVPSDTATNTTASTSGTATETATDTPTATDSAARNTETTDAPSETGIESSADATETDSTAQHIAAAQDALAAAYSAFLTEGDEDALADVTAASYPFKNDEVLAAIDDADRTLGWAAASRSTPKQEQTIAELESMARFLETIAREQERLATAYWWVEDVRDKFFEEAHSTLGDYLDAAVAIGSDTERALDDLEATIDASAARSVEPLDAAAVSDKIEQMRAEIETIDDMKQAFDPGIDGLVHLWDAVRAYNLGNYSVAMSEYGEAADDFGDAVGKFEDLDPTPAFESNVEGMADATAVLEPGCNDLATAAAGKADGADTLADWQITLAHEQFDSNDDVADMPSITDGPGGD